VQSLSTFNVRPLMILARRCFRTHTWRGRLTINMDYNEAVMPWEAVEGFKESVVDMLLKL
jgi:hypothetical protein